MSAQEPSVQRYQQPKFFSKYWGLYTSFFKASLVADLEYRLNFAVRFISDIFWYAGQILTFEVIFMHTPQIGGWNAMQMRVFLAILFIVDAIYMLIWHENFNALTEGVRKGELDLLLVKPVNSQFMISSQRIATAYLGNLAMGLAWFIYTCSVLPGFNWLQLFWLIFMLPASLSVIYFIRFCLNASAIIFTKADYLQFIWYTIFRLGHRPDRIYQTAIRFAVLFILPVGMIVSAPARAILEPPEPLLIIWAVILCPLLFFLSSRYWKFCLSRYTSASS